MARRRTFYPNPQLGGPSAEDERRAADRREIDINQRAADQYTQMRSRDNQQQMDQGAQQISNESARSALAKSLGYDPQQAPPLQAMMARFFSLPPKIQAGIYKNGGAQFIDGKTGMKLLQSTAEDQDKILDARTNEIGSALASGKINYDLDAQGKPAFFSLQDDETDPLGQKKKKVPLNALQLSLLQRGFQRGTIPNVFDPDSQNGTIAAPAVTSKMSSADFQKVLDARAVADGSNSDTANFQRTLDARANGTVLSPNKFAPVATDTGMSFGPPAPAPPASPIPSALRARAAVSNFVSEVPGVADNALDAIGQTYFKDVPRAIGNGMDWLGSFISGKPPVAPPPDAFQTQVVPAQPLTQMDAIMAAEQRRRQQQAADEAANDPAIYNSGWGIN